MANYYEFWKFIEGSIWDGEWNLFSFGLIPCNLQLVGLSWLIVGNFGDLQGENYVVIFTNSTKESNNFYI